MNANKPLLSTWVVFALMLCASLAAWKLTPHVLLADTLPPLHLEEVFPKQFGTWKSINIGKIDIPNPEQQKTIQAVYTDTMSRAYLNDKGQIILLSVAYGRNQGDATSVHYPEVCYPAQGFTVHASETTDLQIASRLIHVKRLQTSQGARVEPLTYWTTVGDKTGVSGSWHKVAQLSYGFKGLIPDGMIVRASSIGSDTPEQFKLQQEFLDAMVRALPEGYRSRVAGS